MLFIPLLNFLEIPNFMHLGITVWYQRFNHELRIWVTNLLQLLKVKETVSSYISYHTSSFCIWLFDTNGIHLQILLVLITGIIPKCCNIVSFIFTVINCLTSSFCLYFFSMFPTISVVNWGFVIQWFFVVLSEMYS